MTPRSPYLVVVLGVAALHISPALAGEMFLQFPLTERISGATKAEAVLWTVREGAQTSIRFAAAPKFAAITVFSRSDDDGQISAIALSPDGRLAVFQTAIAYAGEQTYNPAGLIERPRPRLWMIVTRSGSQPREIGPGVDPEFAADGRLVYRHEGALHVVASDEDVPTAPIVVKGGARFENIAWSSDHQSFLFQEDRGGFSFIGTYRLGADRVEWIVSAPDRLASLAISPDGRRVAYRRFAGRAHSRSYDQTEYEPFSVETVDLASAAARYLTARSEVDPNRLGIWGGSYGGLLTGQALARDSALFKAGVAVHGVLDWSWPTSRPGHLNPSHFFGVGPEDRATALASSPLGAIDRWRSPVLLFSGEEDANVDVLETADLTQKLRARGVEVQTTIVPGESHGFVRHSAWQLLWQQASAFMDSRLADFRTSEP